MHIETENLFLFVYYNMPPLYEWDPRPAVLSWLNSKKHRNVDRPKGKEQEYFRGIFSEASRASTQSLGAHIRIDTKADECGDDNQDDGAGTILTESANERKLRHKLF